jgi:hypothetical protein
MREPADYQVDLMNNLEGKVELSDPKTIDILVSKSIVVIEQIK